MSAFSLLIVEDENLNREELSLILAESGLPVEVVGEAPNGERGLQLMRELLPDLVLTDIRMPRMDGIEMIRRAKAEGFPGKFAILSGYAEFDYAQSAMELEVRHYLLKPLADDEVVRVVRTMCEQLEQERSREQDYAMLQRRDRRQQMLSCLYELFLFQEPAAIAAWKEMLNGRYYTVGILQWYGREAEIPTDEEQRDDDAFFVMQSCYRKNECIFLTLGDSPVIAGRSAAMYAEHLLEGCAAYAAGGVSRAESEAEKICEAYANCLDALLNRFTQSDARLYRARGFVSPLHEEISQAKQMSALDNMLRSLVQINSRSAWEEPVELLGRMFRDKAEHCRDANEMRAFLSQAFATVFAACQNEQIRLFYRSYYVDLLTGEVLHQLGGLQDFRERARTCLLSLTQAEKQAEDIPAIVGRMREFIDLHYAQEIQLDALAAGFHVDTKYLSRTFKKIVGQTFSEYVTMVRLERARELLEKTELSAHAIASVVGYADHQYFHRVFKGKLGVTPIEYRESLSLK